MSCPYLTIEPQNFISERNTDLICQIIGCNEDICFEKIQHVCNTDRYLLDCPIYKFTRNID